MFRTEGSKSFVHVLPAGSSGAWTLSIQVSASGGTPGASTDRIAEQMVK